jgi:hypothetical protein
LHCDFDLAGVGAWGDRAVGRGNRGDRVVGGGRRSVAGSRGVGRGRRWRRGQVLNTDLKQARLAVFVQVIVRHVKIGASKAVKIWKPQNRI